MAFACIIGLCELYIDKFTLWLLCHMLFLWASQVVLVVKNPPDNAADLRDVSSIPGSGRTLEEGMATHSSVLAWRSPRTEEPCGLQSIELQRAGHDWSDLAQHSTQSWYYWIDYLIPHIFKRNPFDYVPESIISWSNF